MVTKVLEKLKMCDVGHLQLYLGVYSSEYSRKIGERVPSDIWDKKGIKNRLDT